MSPQTPALKIVVVEDNHSDARLIEKALKGGALASKVRVANDGNAALDLINAEDGWHPDLILLDLNMPGLSGHDVLARIRSQPSTAHMPVIVMSGSALDEDIRAAYQEGASAYLLKPDGYLEFLRVIAELEHFWLNVVALPPAA